MKKRLYLLRHAKAEPWNPAASDFARALSERGIRHARVLADWMKNSLQPPDTVLCSPARRTRETLAPLLAHWPQLRAATNYDAAMYGASMERLASLAADAFCHGDRLLMVGHNPGLHQFLISVLKREDAHRIHKMPTGALAVVGFPTGFGRDLHDAVLLHFKLRKELGLK